MFLFRYSFSKEFPSQDLLQFRVREGRTFYAVYEFQIVYESIGHKLSVEFSVTYSLSAIDENIGAANVFHGLPGSTAVYKENTNIIKAKHFLQNCLFKLPRVLFKT